MSPLPTKLHVNDFILTVEFENGQVRQIDVRSFLDKGTKADEVKSSLVMCKTAYIEDGISITWKNGFSLDPDVVYEDGMAVDALPATGSFLTKVARALNQPID